MFPRLQNPGSGLLGCAKRIAELKAEAEKDSAPVQDIQQETKAAVENQLEEETPDLSKEHAGHA